MQKVSSDQLRLRLDAKTATVSLAFQGTIFTEIIMPSPKLQYHRF